MLLTPLALLILPSPFDLKPRVGATSVAYGLSGVFDVTDVVIYRMP